MSHTLLDALISFFIYFLLNHKGFIILIIIDKEIEERG